MTFTPEPPPKELRLGPAFHILVHAYLFSLSPDGSLPGHFAQKSRPSDITTSSDKSGKNAREMQTDLSKPQISLDQFEKHAGKKKILMPSISVFLFTLQGRAAFNINVLPFKKKKKSEKAHTCHLFRQRDASEQQFYVSLCIV